MHRGHAIENKGSVKAQINGSRGTPQLRIASRDVLQLGKGLDSEAPDVLLVHVTFQPQNAPHPASDYYLCLWQKATAMALLALLRIETTKDDKVVVVWLTPCCALLFNAINAIHPGRQCLRLPINSTTPATLATGIATWPFCVLVLNSSPSLPTRTAPKEINDGDVDVILLT